MTTPCPHTTCAARIDETMFACRRHWFELSPELRAKVWRDYRSGDLGEIVDNYEAAEREWA